MQREHPKILELKRRSTPISYSSVVIDERGSLQDRKSLLSQRIVAGYGSIWMNKNQHDEKFVKGAFSKSINENGPEANSNYKIKFKDRHGKAVSLLANLTEDEVGLYFRSKPLDKVSWADDLLTQIESGTINNFSIGFRHDWDMVEWDEQDDCLLVMGARLFEISAVDTPSDMETCVVRSSGEFEYLKDDVDDFINSLPRNLQLEARKIITRCMSLVDEEPQGVKRSALEVIEPTDVKSILNYDYLISKLKK